MESSLLFHYFLFPSGRDNFDVVEFQLIFIPHQEFVEPTLAAGEITELIFNEILSVTFFLNFVNLKSGDCLIRVLFSDRVHSQLVKLLENQLSAFLARSLVLGAHPSGIIFVAYF